MIFSNWLSKCVARVTHVLECEYCLILLSINELKANRCVILPQCRRAALPASHSALLTVCSLYIPREATKQTAEVLFKVFNLPVTGHCQARCARRVCSPRYCDVLDTAAVRNILIYFVSAITTRLLLPDEIIRDIWKTNIHVVSPHIAWCDWYKEVYDSIYKRWQIRKWRPSPSAEYIE